MTAMRGLLVAVLLSSAVAYADAGDPPAPPPARKAPEMLGPYKSIKAMCKTLGSLETRYDFHSDRSLDPVAACSKCVFACVANAELFKKSGGLPKPIDEVVLFTSTATTDDSGYSNHMDGSELIESVMNLGVRVGKEWFLFAHIDAGLSDPGLAINAAKVQPMGVDGAPMLIVRYTAHQSNTNRDFAEHQSIFAIGVGPSGKPGVVPPVVIMDHTDDTAYGADAKESSSKMTTNYHLERGAIVIDNATTVVKDEGHTTRDKNKEPQRFSLALP